MPKDRPAPEDAARQQIVELHQAIKDARAAEKELRATIASALEQASEEMLAKATLTANEIDGWVGHAKEILGEAKKFEENSLFSMVSDADELVRKILAVVLPQVILEFRQDTADVLSDPARSALIRAMLGEKK